MNFIVNSLARGILMHSRRTDFHNLIVTSNSWVTRNRKLPLRCPALQNNTTFKMQSGVGLSIESSCLSNTWAHSDRHLNLDSLSPKRTEHVGIWKSFNAVRYSSLLVWTMIFLRASQYVTHYYAHLLMFRGSATTWRSSGVSPNQLLTCIDSTQWTIHIQIIFYNTACFCHIVLHIRLLKRKVYKLYLNAERG